MLKNKKKGGFIVIRIAQKKDAKAIQAIYSPYVKNTTITFDYEVPSIVDFETKIEKTLNHYPFLVYEHYGEVIGYAYAHPYMEKAAYQWSAVLTVYLNEQHTGLRIGQALYQSLIDLLSFQGFKNIYACVTIPNEKSKRLHESFGFREVGFFKEAGFKNGKWYAINWFEKRIGSFGEMPEAVIPFKELEIKTISATLKKNEKLIKIPKK